MKLNDSFEKVDALDDEWLVVPVGETAATDSALLLNHTGSEIWDCLAAGCSEQQIIEAFVQNYSMEEGAASAYVRDFLAALEQYGALEQ